MIDLDNPTDYDRLHCQLEEFLMAAVCVAGKAAHVQAARLHRLLYEHPHALVDVARGPFAKIRAMIDLGCLFESLQAVGMGKYQLLTAAFRAMAARSWNLWTAPWQALTAIPGVREKTAKFFVLHSRRGERVAVLDRHVHSKLRAENYSPPPFPPTNPLTYAFWEGVVLRLADRAGLTPAAYDLAAWRAFRRPPPAPAAPPGTPGRPAGRRSPAALFRPRLRAR